MMCLRPMFLFLLMAMVVAGCQTVPKEEDTEKPPRIGTPTAYVPATNTAALRFESGAFATLFDPASTCSITTAAAAPPAPTPTPFPADGTSAPASPDEATPPTPMPDALPATLIFEASLRSIFEDSSIAYDAVGLRGIRAFLLLPDGSQVAPVQTVLDSALIEVPQGALRSYTRSVTLVFQPGPIMMPTPQPGQPAPAMRLVLEGYGARYYFEWPGIRPGEVRPAPFRQSETYQDVKSAYQKSKDWTKETIHTFD